MIFLHFKSDLKIESLSEETVSLKFPQFHLKLQKPSPPIFQCLQFLSTALCTKESLQKSWEELSGDLPSFFQFMRQLEKQGLISYTIQCEKTPFATLTFHQGMQEPTKAASLPPLLHFSRHAFLRVHEEKFICETPLAPVCLELKNPKACSLISSLSTPVSIEGVKERFPTISKPTLETFLSLLHQFHFLEENNPSLENWEFHDLLFHSRSRTGRHSSPVGATYRFLHRIKPSPALKPSLKEAFPLFKPKIEDLFQSDPSLTKVLEKRLSIREHGTSFLTKKELGEFLYRSARVKSRKPGGHYEATSRPYPGGGACYELEIYPLIYQCEGIEKGLYYYHPEDHTLALIREWNPELIQLLRSAAVSTGKKELPQMCLLIASRFHRVSWKYQSVSYSVMLKNVGALLQTMYLVATAMDLAPCAVGGGNADAFAKIAGCNYYEETTIGEFILGTKPT